MWKWLYVRRYNGIIKDLIDGILEGRGKRLKAIDYQKLCRVLRLKKKKISARSLNVTVIQQHYRVTG